jgi:ParB-like chromosome segregation protein Spo0J
MSITDFSTPSTPVDAAAATPIGVAKKQKRKGDAATNDDPTAHAEALTNYKRSDASSMFPTMGDAEFEALTKDIQVNGLREPIVVNGDEIVDGWHRYRACLALGISPLTKQIDAHADAVALSISLNLQRRQLSTAQRTLIAAKFSLSATANLQQDAGEVQTQSAAVASAAQLFSISERSIWSARRILECGDSDLAHAVLERGLAVSAASNLAREKDDVARASDLARALNEDIEAPTRKETARMLRSIAIRKVPLERSDLEPDDPDVVRQALKRVHDRFESAIKAYDRSLEQLYPIDHSQLRELQIKVAILAKKLNTTLRATCSRNQVNDAESAQSLHGDQ